jgi:hypothetical protein
MILPRKQLVAIEDTLYYPIVSRCVRRSYLCGIDAYSGKDYDLFLLCKTGIHRDAGPFHPCQ